MSATITDTDDTVLTLDEAVRIGLISRHGLQQEAIPGWRLYGARGGDARISNATVIALVAEVCEFLLPIHAYCKLVRPGFFCVLTPWDGFAHPIGEGGPTKCQAWLSAHDATKDQSRPPKVEYRDQVTSLVKVLEQIEADPSSQRTLARDLARKALERHHATL